MSVVEPAEGLRLERPDEPVEMRDGLRDALLDGGDWREGFSNDICIGGVALGAVASALEPAGMDREAFVDIVVGLRPGALALVDGRARWEQFVTGLAGRVGAPCAGCLSDAAPPAGRVPYVSGSIVDRSPTTQCRLTAQ